MARAWAIVLVASAAAMLPRLARGEEGGDERRERLQKLRQMDVDELLDLRILVSAHSKQAEELFQVSSAVSVVTAEDIRRSGARTIPEALRGVPGVEVARIDANSWAVSVRGFNNLFANKLLVLIDGRSVYSGLFSGVIWDMQDLLLEDIDRIEIVRGPGASVWGANAVNGVINIVTRNAERTQGWLATASAGEHETGEVQLRYGGRVGDGLAYRIWGKAFARGDFPGRDGRDGHDEWSQARGGFRADWTPTDADDVLVEGGYYEGNSGSRIDLAASPTQQGDFRGHDDVRGVHALGRWRHRHEAGATTLLQAYYDRTSWGLAVLRERRDAFDLEGQVDLDAIDLAPLGAHELSFGGHYRLSAGRLTRDSFATTIDPLERTDHLVSAFVQDEISLAADRVRLRIGTKIERNDYTGWELQPTARLAFLPSERHTLWIAASRAVRTPCWANEDIRVNAQVLPGPALFAVFGNPGIDAEVLWAFEAGWRARITRDMSIDAAAFYNLYDRLATNITGGVPPGGTPPSPVTLVPDVIDDRGRGRSYGFEVGFSYQVDDHFVFRGSYSYIDLALQTDGSPRSMTPELIEESSPENRFTVQSTVRGPFALEATLMFHYVARVRADDVNAYHRVDLRLSWEPIPELELALVGQNLTVDRHVEFSDPIFLGTEIPRTFYGKLTFRY